MLPIILGPLIGAIISIVTTSSGLTGKTKYVEYQIKRVELIEKLLASIDQGNNRLRRELNYELADIVGAVRESSLQNQELIRLNFSERIWYKRIMPPFTNTLEGRLANFVFYLYLLMGLSYLVIFPLIFLDKPHLYPTESRNMALVSILMSFLFAVLARAWAISAARRAALLRRARRLLILYSRVRDKHS